VIPKPVGLIDPVRRDIRNVDGMPQVAGKKTLCSLIIFQRSLRESKGRSVKHGQQQKN
jgi:hypothetical protein